jgi:hypothetical protein
MINNIKLIKKIIHDIKQTLKEHQWRINANMTQVAWLQCVLKM